MDESVLLQQNAYFGRGRSIASLSLFPFSEQPPERPLSVGVKVRDKESIDRALKRFKRTVGRSRVLRDYRKKMSYTKPSEQRRLDEKRSVRRRHRRRKNSRRPRR
jgi:small subunit ribosomal protein S21